MQLISPIAPHIAEELWERLGHNGGITYVPWPEYDETYTVDDEVEIVIQVKGKIVDRIKIAADLDEKGMEKLALSSEAVQQAISGKTIRKVIAVKGRLVNIVTDLII